MSRAAADEWVSRFEDTIAARVDARRDAISAIRWPQVLPTHTDAKIPADGKGVVPDNLNAVTSDNGDGYSKLNLTIGGPWQAALEINNYGDSQGQGCEYVAYVREGGKLYQRAYKVEGHQRWRLHDWVEIVPMPAETIVAKAWAATTRLASATWRVLNTPISELWRG